MSEELKGGGHTADVNAAPDSGSQLRRLVERRKRLKAALADELPVEKKAELKAELAQIEGTLQVLREAMEE